MCSAVVEWNALKMPVRSSWLIVPSRSSISLLMFLLRVLATIQREVLKSSNVIVDLSIYPFSSTLFVSPYLEVLLLVACTFRIVRSSWWIDFHHYRMSLYSMMSLIVFVLKCTLSDIHVTTTPSFHLCFHLKMLKTFLVWNHFRLVGKFQR